MHTCYECNGSKIYYLRKYKIKCPYCNGTGEVDWIDNIFRNKLTTTEILKSFLSEKINNISCTFYEDKLKNEEFNIEISNLKDKLRNFFNDLEQNKVIYEYMIDEMTSFIGDVDVTKITISAKPWVAPEFIVMNVYIQKDKE